ncbi:alpha-amylase [Streptomyces sp. NPDC004065]|uniref:alpha-amylase n=1 Tax=Streptomyces sp. NPDC004065 TaxID=3364689 RepID=UPI00384A8BAD
MPLTTRLALAAGLFLAVFPPAAASAAPAAGEPAPSCVALYESWRYTQAANACATTVTVKVVYADGAEGQCLTLAPGDTATVGPGYLGEHGHAAWLATCPATPATPAIPATPAGARAAGAR